MWQDLSVFTEYHEKVIKNTMNSADELLILRIGQVDGDEAVLKKISFEELLCVGKALCLEQTDCSNERDIKKVRQFVACVNTVSVVDLD
jgi:hypothetical protein